MRRRFQILGRKTRDGRPSVRDHADIVIVGNGIAGLTAAVEARFLAPVKHVVIITEQSHPTINTPALKQFAIGKLKQEQLLAYPAGTERSSEIAVINARVEEIISREKFVQLSNGQAFGYDSLLLATGSRPNGLPASMPGRAFDGVLTLHRLNNYLDLRRRLQLREVKEAVVIGGGVHAIENVMALLHWGIRVHWLIRGATFLPKVLDHAASEMVLEHCRSVGARVYTETETVGIVGRVGTVAGVVTNHQQTIPCQLVVVSTGTTPAIDLAERCDVPLTHDTGIHVDDYLRTNVCDIYAAGDAAALRNPQTDSFQPHAYWHAAIVQGRMVAAVMAGCTELPSPVSIPWHATHVGGLSLLTVGTPLHRHIGAQTVTESRRNGYRRLCIRDDRLLGYLSLGITQPDGLALKRIIEEGASMRDIEKALLAGEFDARRYFAQQHSRTAHTVAVTGKLSIPITPILPSSTHTLELKRNTEPLLPTVVTGRRHDVLSDEIPLRGPGEKPAPVIGSLKSLMNKQVKIQEWVVPDILPKGLLIIAGKPGTGKSSLSLEIGLGVAGGGAVLGSFEAERGDVLYIAPGESEHRLQERLRTMLVTRMQPPEDFEYATSWPCLDDDGLASLEEWLVSRPRARLVIIDSWTRLRPLINRSAASTIPGAENEAFEGLRSLAQTFNVCILVQYDLRTATPGSLFEELVAGSSASACADGILHLKRARGNRGATLSGTGRAYAHELDLALSFEDGCLTVAEKKRVQALNTLSKARRVIIDLLHEYDRPMRPEEIALALGKPDGTIRKMLFDMKTSDQVKETGQGYVAHVPGDVDTQGHSDNARRDGVGDLHLVERCARARIRG